MKKLIVKITGFFEDDDGTTGVVIMPLDQEISYVSFGALDRGNVSDLTNWGCFSNKGEVEFFDRANEFNEIISKYPNAHVSIYYSSIGVEKLLATFLVDDYDYDAEIKKVKLVLKDKLIDWQYQNVEEYYEFYAKTLDEILGEVGYGVLVSDSVFYNTLSETEINISYIEKANKWANVDKICQATMTRCFCNAAGNPYISDETRSQAPTIIIRPRNILSIENPISNRNTKINDVSIPAYKYTRQLDMPITYDVPFTWYNIKGIKTTAQNIPWILAEFDELNANYSTSLFADGYQHESTSVWATVTLKDHLFEEEFADIKLNVAKNLIGNDVAVDEIYTETKRKTDYTSNEVYIQFPNYAAKNAKEATIFVTEYQFSYVGEIPVKTQKEAIAHKFVTSGTLNWLGNYFTEDGERIFGDQSKYSTQLQTNELIQVDSKFGDKPLAQHIVDTVKEKYSNGVECVVMEVTPSDYFGEGGQAIIGQNTGKQLFGRYDIVVPYVIRNGIEQPYSKDKDGNPKKFKIVGIEYSYNGLLRQKLHLQENV